MTGFRHTLAALGAITLAVVPATATPAMAAAGITDEVTMTLGKGGTLHVVEKISGAEGPLKRTFLTRTRYDDTSDRLYEISNVKGGKLTGDVLTVTAPATVEYDVKGAVTATGGMEELRWFAVNGWDTAVAKATVKVNGPGQVQSLSCFAGELTSAIGCTSASMDHVATQADFEQTGLAPGQALTVVVGFPQGASGGQPIIDKRFSLANAFALSPVTGGALAALLVLLLGGLAALYWTRGRDARIADHEKGAVDPMRDGHFSPPDGVRPGQIGTLVDEQADVVDVTATIVDLAVRGYLRIDEQERQTYDAPDWMLVKQPHAPVTALLPYERTLYDAIFDGRDAVLLSQLSGSFVAHLGKVRDALYTDVVRQGWFARRPDAERTRWTTIGVVAMVVGIVATAALAWFTTYGLIGLALIIAGGALSVGGQYMPAKTAKGSAALAHTLGFREFLFSGDLGDVPEKQRVELFSRYLPYAVIFDGVEHWSRVVASVTGNGSPSDNLYWYHGPAEWDLSKFAGSMRTFTTTTSGAISATRQFRTL
ncbi:DUF2207 domain-containing protein [Nonomuraea glycinis]|uniref:DUF2207 domain-containing protein n=1 Tax=Nonomuraea glycinis TaxID=2047744 RepID=A0A918A9D2_9ACTN|nr:DUF2207 domain-containing protein [Nonomuraea glycinis]MCA2180109.1 DUF2207 domain-containing protein [Nonomuraea glycinis]GGP10898.1 hypothetical protein GCM10012278_52390 [Nonomuraea glycinis]